MNTKTTLSHQIPFSKPDIGEEEIAEVVAVLREGWLTTGPKVKQFESAFQEYLGYGQECIAVNSATAGLHLALEALGVGPGDEVITSPYTFTATAEVVRYLGAEVRFADILPDSLNLDPDQIEKGITKNTRVILPVHLGGRAAAMRDLQTIASAHGIQIVEDAAHALGTYYGGRKIGTLDSAATVFSFYATKCITTGEGGLIATADKRLADRCRVMRIHGIDRDAFSRYRVPGASWYYEIVAPGFKYNLTDIAAALGVVQLKRLDDMTRRRELLAHRYLKELQELPLCLPSSCGPEEQQSWHLFVVRVLPTARISRDKLIERLAEEGIQCSVHYIPLHLHPYWRDRYGLKPTDFPVSLEVYGQALSLPLYSAMTDDDQGKVIEALTRFLKS
ncbi:MAG: DegT/DnrJ/EryC1/StrS family aminotransferase [Bdellovibrionota bacterium]|nr:MAG: DegT/DnrJ/EryC1/StrS family aminotransferase [Bdellovibrionota bacterium]